LNRYRDNTGQNASSEMTVWKLVLCFQKTTLYLWSLWQLN